MDITTTLHQIGGMNVLAISGGRRGRDGEDLILPVAHGYRVRVHLAGNDTYTVTREFVRAGKVSVKGLATDVYAEELGETCYRACCYHDDF
jgi:hypothetical protein